MLAREKAEKGKALIFEAIMETIAANPNGLTNNDVANALGLRSDLPNHSGYLSWSLLHMLIKEGKLEKQQKIYRIPR